QLHGEESHDKNTMAQTSTPTETLTSGDSEDRKQQRKTGGRSDQKASEGKIVSTIG
ncbi:hypothetical protein L195_g063630, partial [Trifolium pratense]